MLRSARARPKVPLSQPPSRAGADKVLIPELADLTYHTMPERELLALFSVSPSVGLDAAQAERRLATNGPNALSPPPSKALQKAIEWVFGGFGSLLLGGSIVSALELGSFFFPC